MYRKLDHHAAGSGSIAVPNTDMKKVYGNKSFPLFEKNDWGQRRPMEVNKCGSNLRQTLHRCGYWWFWTINMVPSTEKQRTLQIQSYRQYIYIYIYTTLQNDDVIKRKHSPRYWPFVRVNSPQGSVTRNFYVCFDLRPNKRLSKQARRRWFGTPLRSLWRHCNGTAANGLSPVRRQIIISMA